MKKKDLKIVHISILQNCNFKSYKIIVYDFLHIVVGFHSENYKEKNT